MIRRTKAEVLPDLPRKQYTTISVNGLPKALRDVLDALDEEWSDVLASGSMPSFEEFSAIRAELAAARIFAMADIVAQHEEAGEALVVFSAHRAPIEALRVREGWMVVTGSETAEQRAEAVRRFQAGELKGIGLTIQAGGTGLTLTHASRMLFVDLAWRPCDNAQAEDRCCRIGQTAGSVQVTRLVSEHPLDKRVLDLLAEKQAVIEAAVEADVEGTSSPSELHGRGRGAPHRSGAPPEGCGHQAGPCRGGRRPEGRPPVHARSV